jgi:hypothetical protein
MEQPGNDTSAFLRTFRPRIRDDPQLFFHSAQPAYCRRHLTRPFARIFFFVLFRVATTAMDALLWRPGFQPAMRSFLRRLVGPVLVASRRFSFIIGGGRARKDFRFFSRGQKTHPQVALNSTADFDGFTAEQGFLTSANN